MGKLENYYETFQLVDVIRLLIYFKIFLEKISRNFEITIRQISAR